MSSAFCASHAPRATGSAAKTRQTPPSPTRPRISQFDIPERFPTTVVDTSPPTTRDVKADHKETRCKFAEKVIRLGANSCVASISACSSERVGPRESADRHEVGQQTNLGAPVMQQH